MPKRATPFRRRLLIPAITHVGRDRRAVGSRLRDAGCELGRAAAAQARPNMVVIETDDQTRESMRVMHNVNARIGDQGATFQNSFVNFSLCCPSRATFLTGQYAHNHRVLGNQSPNGGFDRFEALHGNNNLAVWLQRRRLLHRHDRQVPERVHERPPVPPGWSEWYAAAPNDQDVYNYTLNENGTLVHYGQEPADFKQDVLTRKAVNFVNRRAPKAKPFFLWLTYTAPHVGGPGPNPNPPFNCRGRRQAGAAPRPCVRLRAAAEAPELQRGRRLRQAGRDPEPPALERGSDRGHPAQVPLRAGVAAVGGRGGQEGRRGAEGERRARQHAADLHLGQRLLPRRAPDPQGQAAHLRGVDPGAARDARAGHPAGGERRRPGDQRRPGADDRRRGEREPRPGHGRALADPGRAAIRASSRDAGC